MQLQRAVRLAAMQVDRHTDDRDVRDGEREQREPRPDAGAQVVRDGDGGPDLARLVVSDNGPGIDATRQATIFDAISRAEQNRKGARATIGLPLVKQLAQAHGGTFELVSEPGQGTMVVIELPRG